MKEKTDRPPQPPPIKKKVRFYPHHLAGILVITIIFLLASFGVFDAALGKTQVQSPFVLLEVTYPKKFRYKTREPFEIQVTNTSASSRDVRLSVERKYLSHFSAVTFSPEPEKIQQSDYVFAVRRLKPRETAVIAGALQCEEYGIFTGFVRAETEGRMLEASIRTVSLP